MNLDIEEQEEFYRLFQEFIDSYVHTSDGIIRTSFYKKQRQQGSRNFQEIVNATKMGKDISSITKEICLQLFPYKDNKLNRELGAWIHTNSASHAPIFTELENNDLQDLIETTFELIEKCKSNPVFLAECCENFGARRSALSLEYITPILNALRPDDFKLINEDSICVFNYFCKKSYNKTIINYFELNKNMQFLFKELNGVMDRSGTPAIRVDDLFDIFCYWLVNLKKYNFCHRKSLMLYTLERVSLDLSLDRLGLQKWEKSIERKKQIILCGSPGTGKTYIAEKLARYLTNNIDDRWELIQFHPAYTYEDFIQGIRPIAENGLITYNMVPGRFIEFCQKAESYQGTCVLIIDEINRANLAQVFGELMYLLEYRDRQIRLAGSNELFGIPENVRIIGTMNTADRSIALVDHALRRRFAFIHLHPNYDVLRRYHQRETELNVDSLIKILENLNQAIDDPHYEIGISFFMTKDLKEELADIWEMEIEPYLEEYFFDRCQKVEEFRWERIKSKIDLRSQSERSN